MLKKEKIRVLELGGQEKLYGAERWILALGRNIDLEKFDLIISVIKDKFEGDTPLCKEANKLRLKTHKFTAYGRFNGAAIKLIRKFIVDNEVDILHSHGYKADLIGLLSTVGTSCKLITTPHGWSREVDLKLKLYELLDRLAFIFFDAVIPLSDGLYSELKRYPILKSKLFLIRNGIDLTEIDSAKKSVSAVTKLKENNFVIGYIGQLIHRKGVDCLLHAFSNLSIPNKKLFIVGDGPQMNEFKNLANKLGVKNSVIFTGFKKNRLSYLKSFDVFVLPSRLEGIPRCLMEAMAAGIPAVASDTAGSKTLIKNKITGFLYRIDNTGELTSALLNLSENKSLCKKVASNARHFVRKNFSAKKMALEYESLFRKMVK